MLRRQRQETAHRLQPQAGALAWVREAPLQHGLQGGLRQPGAERERLLDGRHEGAGWGLWGG